MNSRTYITRFTELDREPAPDGPARDEQIVRITRRLLPAVTEAATDEQVLRLHRDYMRGIY